MNSLKRATFGLVSISGNQLNAMKNIWGKRDFTRTLWHMCKTPENNYKTANLIKVNNPSLGCNCGCSNKFMHTKGERELVEFLTEEIIAERKAQKEKAIPNVLDGFQVKYTGAEVELVKQSDKEKVVINFNVNHSVDAEDEGESESNTEKAGISDMRSTPQFEVDIIRGPSTLSFTCSFLQGAPQEGEYNDVFSIDELSIFKGEWNDKIYAVSGDVLDGYLYDLLMNVLEEKGISNEFVEKLSDLATAYEHTSYIGLLEELSKFATGK